MMEASPGKINPTKLIRQRLVIGQYKSINHRDLQFEPILFLNALLFDKGISVVYM